MAISIPEWTNSRYLNDILVFILAGNENTLTIFHNPRTSS